MKQPLLLHQMLGLELPHGVDVVFYTWIAMAFILLIALAVKKSLTLLPEGLQNAVEAVLEALMALFEESFTSSMARFFFPFLATLFIFILVSNFMGLVPGLEAPTGNFNTTSALALPVFFATHIFGIKTHGFGYINQFVGPIRSPLALPLMILMLFIETIGQIARPFTLAVRLFGNMLAKHMILVILAMIAPLIAPTAILGLGALVSVVQALVFVLLSTIYLAGAVEEGGH
jgi:F-type H+-transporting ATPase subunit a